MEELSSPMGLIFPLQPDLRKSTPQELVLISTTKRFTVGATFLFVGLVLIVMHLAASPILSKMWTEGEWIDKGIVSFFYGIVYLFPVFALLCWFYKAKVSFKKTEEGKLEISSQESFGPITWSRSQKKIESLDDLEIVNWKGAVNMASLQAQRKGTPDRYATRGHWLLRPKMHPEWIIERRAKRDDVDWLLAQIDAYFKNP